MPSQTMLVGSFVNDTIDPLKPYFVNSNFYCLTKYFRKKEQMLFEKMAYISDFLK
jgi:hypothetical protein